MICRYKNCNCEITDNDYIKVNNRYYHKTCYDKKLKDEEINSKINSSYKFWCDNISNLTSYGEFRKAINGFLARGINIDYISFTIKYIVNNKMSINYANGLTYYFDNADIKSAYKKYITPKIDIQSFIAPPNDDTSFHIENKPTGFNRIFGRENDE